MDYKMTIAGLERHLPLCKVTDDLYIAGQWVMSPGGLPIAVVSGKFAVQRILKREKRSIDI